LVIGVDQARSIAHHRTRDGIFTDMADGRNCVLGQKSHEPVTLRVEEGIVLNHEPSDVISPKGREIRFEFGFDLRLQDK